MTSQFVVVPLQILLRKRSKDFISQICHVQFLNSIEEVCKADVQIYLSMCTPDFHFPKHHATVCHTLLGANFAALLVLIYRLKEFPLSAILLACQSTATDAMVITKSAFSLKHSSFVSRPCGTCEHFENSWKKKFVSGNYSCL